MRLVQHMMASSNGNIFRVTGPLCGEFTGPGDFPTQRPVTRSFDVFFDLRLNKRSWGWWFETLSRPFWRHRNEYISIQSLQLTASYASGFAWFGTKLNLQWYFFMNSIECFVFLVDGKGELTGLIGLWGLQCVFFSQPTLVLTNEWWICSTLFADVRRHFDRLSSWGQYIERYFYLSNST